MSSKDKSNLLADELDKAGLLAPLLTIALDDIAHQHPRPHTEDPVLLRYRAMFPELSDEELDDLANVT